MKLPEPPSIFAYRLFLSSSNDDLTRSLRERVKCLVEDVINPLLDGYPEAGVRISLVMWEREPAQRPPAGGSVNDIFVEKARTPSLTMVLLAGEIKPGSREELEAALAEPGVQVAVLVFDRSGAEVAKLEELNTYLKAHEEKGFLYFKCGDPDSNEAWLALTRQLFAFTLTAIRDRDPRTKRTTLMEVR